MLRNEMKWNNYMQSHNAQANAGSSEQVNNETTPADGTLPARIERHMGRDTAKKQRSSTSSSSSSACLELLHRMLMDRNAHDERVEAANKLEAQDYASRAEQK